MRDLTDRALDTASARGAGYADVRVVRRLEESIAIKTGRVEGVASGESEGFGVRVLVDGAWGFAASHVLTAAEADRVAAEAVRIARASATALRDRTALDDRPPARGTLRDAGRGGPVRGPARDEDRRPARRRRGGRPASRASPSPSRRTRAQREWKTFAATDGSLTEQVITHVGAGDRGQRRRRRRAPAPELPGLGRRLAGGGGYEYIRAPRPRRARRARWPRRPSRC